MSEQEWPDPVRLYTPEHRGRVLRFLRSVDEKFVPPLSSPLRQGGLEAYLDYSLSAGHGRIIVYEVEDRIVGYLAFRYERHSEGGPCDSIYLSNMCVGESLMGLTLMRLMRGMVQVVTREQRDQPTRIWAKTWRENRASSRTLTRLGMQHVETIPRDPEFGQCRDTVIYSGSWNAFIQNLEELDPPGEVKEIDGGKHEEEQG